MTTTVDISTLLTIQDLLALLKSDKEVILTEANAPIAQITSINQVQIPEDGRVPDTVSGVWISKDFNAQLPESFWINRKL